MHIITPVVLLTITTAAHPQHLSTPAWEVHLEGPVSARPIAVEGGVLVAAGSRVQKLDRNGEKLQAIETKGSVLATPLHLEDRIVVHSSAGLTAYSVTGDLLWHHASEDRGALVAGKSWGWGEGTFSDPWAFYRSSPVYADEAIIFGDSSGVHAVDATTGALRWSATGAPVTVDPVVYGDVVIVGDWHNQLRALSLDSGSVAWTFEGRLVEGRMAGWEGWKGFHLNPLIVDDRVYAGTRGTYFYAIDAAKGEEIWSIKEATSWIGSPPVASDDDVCFGLSDGKAVVCHQRRTGNQTLFVPTPGPVFATPVVLGEVMVAGTLTGKILIVDRKSGVLRKTLSLHESDRSYESYFQPPEADTEFDVFEFTRTQLHAMKAQLRSVLSLTQTENLLLVATGDGSVIAYDRNGVSVD